MKKERIESIRRIMLPFIAEKLKEIDYEGMGEFDAKEFTKDFNEILNLAEEALQQEPKTGWIPVSKRPPKQYEEVIVTDVETSETYQSRYIGNGYWECDNGTLKNRIIAWMPKPKPYKGEREDEI